MGFLLFPLAFTLYFWSRGALPDFVRCVFVVNYTYLKASPAPFFFFDPRYGLSLIWQLIRLENGPLWLLSPAALVFILAKERKPELVLLIFWGFFSFVGVAAGTRFFGHYFIQVIPALSLLSG
ncbi:hypothetical protein HZB08_01330 [Candidatus Saganbacteria bacterium]|uniref:Uncharacterized protein n=1 Tax=Candidatus Saganbacteria bacterium TaxID=2575572 RepID=A0A9D6YXK7_UNCSA|nr:hypothetical protein [Candidatus Saganbacteria bacterium]